MILPDEEWSHAVSLGKRWLDDQETKILYAGNNGVVIVGWWDEKANRRRVTVGYVGEDGIEPDVWYRVENEKLVKVSA